MVNLKNGAFLVTIHTFWNELSTQKPLKLTLPSNQSFRNRPQSSKIRIVLFLRHMVEISKTALIYLFIFLSFKYESHHRPKDLSKEPKMIEKIEQRRLHSAGIGSVSHLQDQLLCEEIYSDKFGRAFCLPGQNLLG